MEVILECYICHERFTIKGFNGNTSVLDALHCPKCLKEEGLFTSFSHIPLSKIIRHKDDFYRHTIPEDNWSVPVQDRWVRISPDKVPDEVKAAIL